MTTWEDIASIKSKEYVPLGTFWSLDWDSPDDTLTLDLERQLNPCVITMTVLVRAPYQSHGGLMDSLCHSAFQRQPQPTREPWTCDGLR